MTIQAPWNDLLINPLPTDHVVHLYEDHRFHLEAMSLFAGSALGQGEAAIVVATECHLRSLDDSLTEDGFEVEVLKQWGQLRMIEAEVLLASFMIDGWPDAVLFRNLVGGLIETARAAGPYRKVRVYGEMVDLLWKDSLLATQRLEEYWNEVIERHRVPLLCGYAVDRPGPPQPAFPPELSRAHTHSMSHASCA
jgi:hypothetical protein